MAKYIDKDKIAAEIEKIIATEEESIKSFEHHKNVSEQVRFNVRIDLLRYVLSFLDTLEVKEVDLEKEAELIANGIMIPVQANLYHTNIYNFEKRCFKHSDLKEAARKGIELGLKAKGE